MATMKTAERMKTRGTIAVEWWCGRALEIATYCMQGAPRWHVKDTRYSREQGFGVFGVACECCGTIWLNHEDPIDSTNAALMRLWEPSGYVAMD